MNKTPDGVVIGLVQLQQPTITSDLAAQTKKICAMVQKARKNMSTMDLVVFPEYSLHGRATAAGKLTSFHAPLIRKSPTTNARAIGQVHL